MDTQEIVESVGDMTIKELTELVEAIEEEFDVSADAAAPVAAAPQGEAGGDGEESGEPETIDLVLTNTGQKKIKVIKELKDITGKGLKECKSLVDELPNPVQEGLDEEEAQELKERLEELGAEVELR
ncbi:MAG: 50S ribosomal protein L7/L12 [Candidatus Bipolaricaulota bacterium]|nr:50S ribosomal protein L7/L12 [Candidatus Bipolaricaulota bacterium]MBS3791715.1 50S ribosomal protein L7/L12 [Candidatus Bipolaricaulota bacterium]